jgi:hypothetical protein
MAHHDSFKYHTEFGEDEGTDRLEHISHQACCDCGMNVGEVKARYVFLAETKKAHELMIDCGEIEGDRRWICCMSYVLREENEPLQAAADSDWQKAAQVVQPICRGLDIDYVAPLIAGLDKLGGHEPIYQRQGWGGGGGREEREAVVMERRTRKYMRGAEVLLPDNFALGSGI